MTSIIKNLFRSKKPKNRVSESPDRYSLSDHESLRPNFRHSRDYLSSTAAYHTSTKSRHRGPRSCPGEILDDPNCYSGPIRSYESELHVASHERRRPTSKRVRRVHTASPDYGSANPSPVTIYNTYNRKLDDSDSDTWTADYEQAQRIRELEIRVRDQRSKLKEYKERLRSERDLRVMNERTLMEEVERYKRDLKREQRDRKITEQRYLEIINAMKAKLSMIEQRFPKVPILSAATVGGTVNCGDMPRVNGAGEFLCSMSNTSLLTKNDFNCLEEHDETKNFRKHSPNGLQLAGLEVARQEQVSVAVASTIHNQSNLTDLQADDSDNGYTTTSEGFSNNTTLRPDTVVELRHCHRTSV